MTTFTEKYKILPKYIPVPSKRRSGILVQKVVFIVVHDTGNEGSTAMQNVNYFINSCNNQYNEPGFNSASAHIFVDDTGIIECVPALTATPEKAWHVFYSVEDDNRLYGVDANDAAIGVEYCYGPNINADESYKRYVWIIAKLCFEFKLNVKTSVCGHFIIDPLRRRDPVYGLLKSRRTYDQLLKDVETEYSICTGGTPQQYILVPDKGQKTTTVKLNIRLDMPDTRSAIVRVVPSGTVLDHVAYVTDGQSVNGNTVWYKNKDGNYFWSGGVR